ncbi:MAG TPA: hypothetical protein VGM25_04580 [Caulobacteraceae bacterium]|jgi:hypothetical protein
MSILYPIASGVEAALSTPRGRAARERDAERVVSEPVAFVREFIGPAFRDEAEARAHWAGRLDDERPDQRVSVAPEDRFCDLKPIIQRSRTPFLKPHTVWRLSVAYWRVGGGAAPDADTAQARKARRQKAGPAPDGDALETLTNQPLRPIKPQQPLDIGLFEVRLPENPHIVVPDE